MHAVDIFGDEDTRGSAASMTVAPSIGPEFDLSPLPDLVANICVQHPVEGIVYGSGFEHCPSLLAALCPPSLLLGNPPDIVQRIKDPAQFFPALDRLGITHPQTNWRQQAPGADWLQKRIGGAGGAHIRPLQRGESVESGCYSQRRISGRSMSALFLANGEQARLLGMCEHWCAQPALLSPFQHSGVVRRVEVAVEAGLIAQIIDPIVRAFELRGLCGIDFMRDTRGAVHVLEINPRPPASFELTEGEESLFAAHVAACRGRLAPVEVAPRLRASAVCYAPIPWRRPEHWSWPAWVTDRPGKGRHVPRGAPLCTVLAEGETGAEARHTAQQRLDEIMRQVVEPHAADSPAG
ncbi:MAG: ATP-grasp domain-containing protein [Chromatiales bacterium]